MSGRCGNPTSRLLQFGLSATARPNKRPIASIEKGVHELEWKTRREDPYIHSTDSDVRSGIHDGAAVLPYGRNQLYTGRGLMA